MKTFLQAEPWAEETNELFEGARENTLKQRNGDDDEKANTISKLEELQARLSKRRDKEKGAGASEAKEDAALSPKKLYASIQVEQRLGRLNDEGLDLGLPTNLVQQTHT